MLRFPSMVVAIAPAQYVDELGEFVHNSDELSIAFGPQVDDALAVLGLVSLDGKGRAAETDKASYVILDSTTEVSELLWSIEALLRQAGIRWPRAVARTVLALLAADGCIEFLRRASGDERERPIPLAEGLAALERDEEWALGGHPVTVFATEAGWRRYQSLAPAYLDR